MPAAARAAFPALLLPSARPRARAAPPRACSTSSSAREPSRGAFNRLLRLHCRAGDPDASLALLSRMDALGVAADATALSALVLSLSSLGRPHEAEAVLLEMLLLSLPPSPAALRSLLRAFLHLRLLPPALRLLSLMRRFRVPPDPPCRAALLSAYSACGMWRNALRVVEDDPLLVPRDAVVDALGRCGCLEAMRAAFQGLREGGRPAAAAWSSLVRWHLRGGEVDRAVGFLVEMQEEGMYPDSRVFLAVIRALGEAGRWAEVRELYEGMIRKGFRKSAAIYAVLADVYGQYGMFRDARECVEALRREGMELSASVFCVLANAYAQQGLCEQTVQVFRLMEAEGVKPNVKMLNLLINAFGVAGRYLEATSVFEHIKESGLSPDVVTYSTLMKAFMRARKYEQIPKIFREMETAGLTADRKAMTMFEDAMFALTQRG